MIFLKKYFPKKVLKTSNNPKGKVKRFICLPAKISTLPNAPVAL